MGEIRFRLRQEVLNAALFIAPPSLGSPVLPGLPLLPSPQTFVPALRDTPFASEIESLARSVCEHRFPLLGYKIETGAAIRWRRDYVHNVESDLRFFRRIPYLNAELAGDHKIIWELNRHQHLVVLAQAWQLTGRAEFPQEISKQLESWWEQNPYLRGINWTSALEVAYRAFAWIWIYHLAGNSLSRGCTERLMKELYRHGVYLEHNLSVYFSPNTHLLGEVVVLHALGALFPHWPRSRGWKLLGGRIVAEQMQNQVREDGSHFEQSSAYHIYAMDLFLFHALLEPVEEAYRSRLRWMADYLAALTSGDGMIPLMGDDDGGRIFHPYGNRRRFGAATLASCCVFFGREDWPYVAGDLAEQAVFWYGTRALEGRPGKPQPASARFFPDAGVAILSATPVHVVTDTRAFGHASAGHSHAHALQVVCRREGRDILIDPGTFTYVGSPEWRRRFRGTAYHNTVSIDGLDQATGTGPFRWAGKPVCEVLRWTSNEEWTLLDAACSYRGFRHRRLVLRIPRLELMAIGDRITGDDREIHRLEQFWHCGDVVGTTSRGNYRIGGSAVLAVPSGCEVELGEGGEYGWQSEIPGSKVPRPVIVVRKNSAMPAVMGVILIAGLEADFSLSLEVREDAIRFHCGDDRWIELPFGDDPSIHWTQGATTLEL
jgi:hypothetical protein